MCEDLKCDFRWITGSLPFVFCVVVANSSKVAESSRLEEDLELGCNFW